MMLLQGTVCSHALKAAHSIASGPNSAVLHSSVACSLLEVAVVLATPVPTKNSGSDPVGLQCRCLPLI